MVSPGALALVQDGGRPGQAHLGVGCSGAMDRSAHALANRLVGNTSDAAALEILLGGFSAVVREPLWFAVTGAWGELSLDGHTVEPHTATRAPAGSTIRIGTATAGLRFYLAVRGGISADVVLGSRSRDTLAGLGPAPLAAGQVVPVGAEPATPVPAVDLVPVGPPAASAVLQLRPGPRVDWFDDVSWHRLFTTEWTTSARSDRTGVRLESAAGVRLERSRGGELPSEGMVSGAIQVSPDGSPTILATDHPVTGGYPVIAVVTDASFDALAQLRPGSAVRFTLATGHA
ncbi:MAG: hypothetical protein JWQ43_798 [Glaciihabitans sp.]|nr:hypothetical protein [Glaciihabitans sp.]